MTTHTGHGPLTPHEISFLAESEEITIVPRQRLDSLHLISGTIPTFYPPQRATVPLWLALVLRKQRRCNIVPPDWLNTPFIENIYKWELDNPMFSSSLPWRWLETAEILLEAAADDIPDACVGGERDLRVLLRGLREVRQTKAREGLKQLESTYLQMNGLGIMEITELRGFAGAVVDGLRRLEATREEIRLGREEAGEEDDDEYGSSVRGSSVAARSTTTGRTGRSGTAGRSSVTGGRSSVAVRGSAFDDDDDF